MEAGSDRVRIAFGHVLAKHTHVSYIRHTVVDSKIVHPQLPHVEYFTVVKIWCGEILLEVVGDHVHTVFAAERMVAVESPSLPPPTVLGCFFLFSLHCVTGLCLFLVVRLFFLQRFFFCTMGGVNGNGQFITSGTCIGSRRPEPQIKFCVKDASVIVLADCGLYWSVRDFIL